MLKLFDTIGFGDPMGTAMMFRDPLEFSINKRFIDPLTAGLLAGGIGLSAAQLFGGGGGGTSPSAKVNLTKRGKQLETAQITALKERKFPQTLTSRFIGDAFKEDILNRRAFRKQLSSTGVGGKDVTRSPLTSVLKGSTRNVRLAGRGQEAGFTARRGFERERLANLQNFINQELQLAPLSARAGFINEAQKQAQGARRGAAIGGIAQGAAGFAAFA